MNEARCRSPHIDQKLDDSKVQQLETSKFVSRVSTGQGIVAPLKTRMDGARYRQKDLCRLG